MTPPMFPLSFHLARDTYTALNTELVRQFELQTAGLPADFSGRRPTARSIRNAVLGEIVALGLAEYTRRRPAPRSTTARAKK